MSYEDLASYKLLLALGCIDETGPVMRKRGVVKIDSTSQAVNRPYYHFDPHYQINGEFYSKAARKQGTSSYEFFIKTFNEKDYDLAFMAFALNVLGFKKMKITDLTEEKWAKTILKKKEIIFKKIFEGEIYG